MIAPELVFVLCFTCFLAGMFYVWWFSYSASDKPTIVEPEIEWNVVLDQMSEKLPLGDLVYFCIKEDMIAARVSMHSTAYEDRKAVLTTYMTFVSPNEMIDLTNEQIDAVAEYLRETDQAQKFSKKLEEYD